MAASDTLSPVWPDRPIRPLPKNRLRAKLSPEQADAINFPPNPPTTSPLFSFPYGLGDTNGTRSSSQTNGHRHASPTHCTCGHEHDDSEEEEGAYDHPSYRWSSPGVEGGRLESVQKKLLEASKLPLKPPPPPASTASSADGYESFENTSNKKKRKIPLSGGSSAHQSSLSAELANMGISSHGGDGASDDVNGDAAGHYHHSHGSTTSGGTGVAGAGRGRTGRHSVRGERRSLGGPITSVTNGYTSNVSARSRGGNWKGDGTKTKQNADQGIISAAIASAADSQPSTPLRGKENISLLSQQSPKSSTPKTQFTFTCESDSSNKMVWPGQDGTQYPSPTPTAGNATYARGPISPAARAMGQQATHRQQTTPPLRGGTGAPAGVPPGQNPPPPGNGVRPPRPRRRRPSKEFELAARQRQLQQEYTNYHHKPSKDSMWICEFCEYEDIFGEPPSALIRQYEIKDRRQRRAEEEQRRLLEKAKMKGRKKKGGKAGKNAAQPPANPAQPYDGGLDVPLPPDPNDEYYDDEYEDGYDPANPSNPNDQRYADDYEYGPERTSPIDSGQAHSATTPVVGA